MSERERDERDLKILALLDAGETTYSVAKITGWSRGLITKLMRESKE